jgi:hypothetical protein
VSGENLRKLRGKHVQVVGWLFHEPDSASEPRGTLWEIHPVTSISVVP